MEHPHYCSLPHVISLILHTDMSQLLERISANPEAAGFTASLKQALHKEASNQVAGVVSTLRTNLAKLNTPDIFSDTLRKRPRFKHQRPPKPKIPLYRQ
ncbi:hypothetical protein NYZ99_05000 [Maribacter litopenaei]|uniref:Uncharacterized protein n=1 Tax=Maribacter litopenaei TaxID=2976127 RepID=A0ABY5Y9S8_9FLAO|nr:hypothetical protein [Maribacter litopenaei]UWX55781.1 hypothetical protein NYZ99_05000 [Maribacter litopenaei]